MTTGREQTFASSAVLGPLHVKQGVNNYEWFVYEGSVKVTPKPLHTWREAAAWMDGYAAGRMYEPS